MPAASFELVVFLLIAALAGLAALFAALCFFRMRPQATALTEQAAGRMLRSETDIVRAAVEDQSRGLRQELGRTLASFQDVTLKAFGTLRDGIDVQIRTFGERLDAGVKATGESVTTISTKLTHDMEQMRGEANTHLRSSADIPLFRSMWIFHNGLSGAKNSWPCTSDTRRLSRGHLPGRRCTRKKRSMPFVVLPWSPE